MWSFSLAIYAFEFSKKVILCLSISIYSKLDFKAKAMSSYSLQWEWSDILATLDDCCFYLFALINDNPNL